MFFNKKLNIHSSNLDCYIEHLKKGDLRYLPWIFCVFSEDSTKHKLKAAKALNEVLNELSFDELCRADMRMRETTSMEWSIDWRSLGIEDFITKQMSEEEKRAVLVFTSFNPNGYIREQAIKILAELKESLPFILLRCNDWVYQVRQSALSLLSKRLISASDKEVVNALPLMEKLRRGQRCEYSSIRSIIVGTLGYNKSLIEKGLGSNMDRNTQVRTLARSIISKSERKIDFRKLYMENLATCTVVSLSGLGEVGCKEDCNLIEKFLTNHSISVVRGEMTSLMRLDPARYIYCITEKLSSEHAGIVKTAALLLKKNKGYEFERVFQIQEISSNENVKVKCATLLFLSWKWKSLIYTLTLLGSEYEKLESLCQIQIRRWIFSYNRSFVMISEKEKQRIEELLTEKKGFLTPEIRKQLLFLSR